MALKLVTPPTAEAITLEEVRDHLKCGTDEDDYLERLIKACVTHTETVTKLRFMPQTWKQTYHYFPPSFQLQLGPYRSITSLKYRNQNGDLITVASDGYRIDDISDPVSLYTPASSSSWPDSSSDILNAVELTYVVGYTPTDEAEDDDPLKFPEDLKQAILLLIGHLYANREPVVVGAGIVSAMVPKTFDYLITPYRRWLF